jgi:hypothetical protein
MPVSIIGMNGCGKTVFLGLLYESLVHLTNDKKNAGTGELRVNTEPQTAMAFGDIRLDLMSGRWPSKEQKEGISLCMIELGFRRGSFLGLFPSSKFDMMEVHNTDIKEKDVRTIKVTQRYNEALSGKDVGESLDLYSFSESFRDVLDRSTIILLIDASHIDNMDDAGSVILVKEADAFNATVLDAMIKNRTERGREGSGNAMISPVIFLTKADRSIDLGSDLGESSDSFKDEGESSSYPERRSSRRKIALEVMREHYPNTMDVLENDQNKKAMIHNVEFFISGLRTEKDENGLMIPVTRVDKGQVKLDYPFGEYVSFIEHLGKIAKKHPDVIDANGFRKRR